MTCKECNTRNPIGNKFCRECGSKIVIPEGSLAAEEAERAENERKTERAAVLLADAHLLAEQGKYLGAIPIVEEAIALVPFSASAYTLLVTLYEHTDQMERAVAAQGRLVEMQPEADAEKTRLERLKRGERTSPPPARVSAGGNLPTLRGASEREETMPLFPQWARVSAAVAGGAFVFFLGYMAMTPRDVVQAKPRAAASPVVVVTSNPSEAMLATNNMVAPAPASNSTRGNDPFVSLDPVRQTLQAEAARRDGTAATKVPTTPAPVPPRTLGALRPPSVPGSSVRTGSAPMIVNISKGVTTSAEEAPLPTIAAAPPSSSSPSATPERIDAAPPASDPAKPSGGYMRIQVNAPSNSVAVAAAPASNKASADMDADPLRRARTYQRLERYNDAIGAYREAIAAGVSAGDAYQNIALCYQHIGDSANARSAYQQAIAAFDAQIKSGRSASAATRGKQSCEAALEVLGG